MINVTNQFLTAGVLVSGHQRQQRQPGCDSLTRYQPHCHRPYNVIIETEKEKPDSIASICEHSFCRPINMSIHHTTIINEPNDFYLIDQTDPQKTTFYY